MISWLLKMSSDFDLHCFQKVYYFELGMCPWDTDAPAIAKFAKIVTFHKQRAITPECMMQYEPLSILTKTWC